MKLPALAAFLVTAAAPLAPAAYLTSDYGETAREAPPRVLPPPRPPAPPLPLPPPRPLPPPPPSPGTPAEVNRLIMELKIGAPQSYGRLVIYPLERHTAATPPHVTTLEEAFARGWLEVRESRRPRVSEVQVRNAGHRPVFLLAGETLAGGKQDRLVRHATVLPARSGFLTVEVYCIERERWSPAPETETFSLRGHLAHPGLRGRAAGGASQAEVWDEVQERAKSARVNSPTDNYHALYADGALARQIEACRPHFIHLPRPRTVGAVAVVSGRIAGADIFADPDLFAREWPKLFNSYALEYFSQPGGAVHHHRRRANPWPAPPAADVSRFLRAALSARYSALPTPGEGRLLQISGAARGETLLWRGHALHVGLFGTGFAPPPPPDVVVPLHRRRR